MRSEPPGKSTSTIEVTNISEHGIWLLIDEEEHFLPFEQFPWFQAATVEQIRNIERPSDHHLYWPALDVDLSLECIRDPERYPLVSRSTGSDAAGNAAKRHN